MATVGVVLTLQMDIAEASAVASFLNSALGDSRVCEQAGEIDTEVTASVFRTLQQTVERL